MTTHSPLPPEATTPPKAPPQNKKPLFSKLVVGGIAVAVVLIAILAVALVQVLPAAFGSLANLYNTLHSSQNDRTLTVNQSAESIRSGDSMSLSWATTTPAGIYTFSYRCADEPLTVEIRKDDGLRNVRCDTVYSLGETASLEIIARTEQSESVNVSYTIGFLRTNDTDPRASYTGEITVTDGLTKTPTPEIPETTEVAPVIETPLVKIETPQLPQINTPTTITTYPTSDPSGRTDLAVRFVAVGIQSGGVFVPRASLLPERQNALRFEVFNHGTKTSRSWSYTIHLPNGSTYKSPAQSPLLPNERATITLGFQMGDESRSVSTSVSIDVPGDATSLNDRFVETIRVSR